MEMYFKEHRDRDFFTLCEVVRKEVKSPLSISEIALKAVHREAQSFYLSEREYVRIYRKARLMPDCRSEIRNEMYREIQRRFLEEKRKNPGLNHFQIARIIGEQTAPRFYISDGRAIQLYYSLLKYMK
jgi:hypothetical protein